jgi:hypothetical protein
MTMSAELDSEVDRSGKKAFDSTTAEVLALTVFRAIFGHGVRVPFKMKGIVDMDLIVKDGNVVFNLNEFEATRPTLTVWRLTFAYRGKPVVEYGRGIKNDVKIHFPQLCIFLFSVWRGNRRRRMALAKAEEITLRELRTIPQHHEPMGSPAGPPT